LFSPTATTGIVYFDDIFLSKQVTALGPQVTTTTTHGAAFGYDENGKEMLYVVTDGSSTTPPTLSIIDYNTNQVVRTLDVDIPGGTSRAWAVTYSGDGYVYMGILNMTSGAVYRYAPGDTVVESLGVPASGSGNIWDVK